MRCFFQHITIRFLALAAAVLCTSCAAESAPLAAPAPPSADPAASLRGRIPAAPLRWPGQALIVYAAPFFGEDPTRGFFMLDPDRHPHALAAAGGAFELRLDPGRYVLVVGPRPEEALPVVGADSIPRLVGLAAGQELDLGDLPLAP